LLFAISCQKENSNLQSSPRNEESDVVAAKYAAVNIGAQKWMARNLDVTRYKNGDRIPQVQDPAKWMKLTTGAWCWFNNDSATGALYGRLYNWYAVNDSRGLAPTGWHVPSAGEWDALSTFLSGKVGGKMKDTGTIESGTGLWRAPNFGATNESGFTGLPGGYRSNYDGSFYSIGYAGYWWTSGDKDAASAWFQKLIYTSRKLASNAANKNIAFSVRCIRD
jgi:uncharacterized protein (TIGR02145 family)